MNIIRISGFYNIRQAMLCLENQGLFSKKHGYMVGGPELYNDPDEVVEESAERMIFYGNHITHVAAMACNNIVLFENPDTFELFQRGIKRLNSMKSAPF